MVTELAGRTAEEVAAFLGGYPERVQLSPQHLLLVNSSAREQHLGKNREASTLWWGQHPVSGLGADFILGPALRCTTAEADALNLLSATMKPVLTPEERIGARAGQGYEEAKLTYSLNNPEGCEMCGS